MCEVPNSMNRIDDPEPQESSQLDEAACYLPFGDEWIKKMKKLTKMELIQMVRGLKDLDSCPLYTDYTKSCQALKDRIKELGR